MKKVHLILLALVLVGCMEDSWWEPRTIITYAESGQALGRYQFTYDERGNKFTETGDLWDEATGTWQRNYRISYSYDIYGLRTGALNEKRDSLSGKWQAQSRIICQYATETSLLEKETHQIFTEDTALWEDAFKDHYIRDDQGRLLYIVREKWNNGEIERDFTLRGKFVLRAHLATGVEGWENFIRDSFAYDQEGTLLGGKIDTWDQPSQQWTPVFRYEYLYDKEGNATGEKEEKWDEASGTWSEIGRYAYTYDKHDNTVESQYIPSDKHPRAGHYLVFYYNKMKSSVGYYLGDTGTFPGVRGTAEYFRQKR